jgi:hypothetical protein
VRDRRADQQATAAVPVPPRLLGLYREVVDDEGRMTGWEPIGWAIDLHERGVVTVPATGPVGATTWHSLADAQEALDAHVDEIRPRRRVMELVR